jgi:anti-anti-sigma factor
MASEQQDISDGTLEVRRAREGDRETISLHGELDLANAATADRALNAALEEASSEVVVDLRKLEFIDSTGIALLVTALGRNGSDTRLSFIASESPAVTRVLELTGLAERLPLTE